MEVLIKKLCAEDEFKFDVKEELRIGTMRVDFVDGALANIFFPTEFFETFLNKFSKAAVDEVQNVVNDIQFRFLNTFDKVIDTCKGQGYEYQTNRFVEYGRCNYWIRLIPVKGDYNYYIKAYLKEELHNKCA